MSDENETNEPVEAKILTFPTDKILRISPNPELVNEPFKDLSRDTAKLKQEKARKQDSYTVDPSLTYNIAVIKKSFAWMVQHDIEQADKLGGWCNDQVDIYFKNLYKPKGDE